MRKKYDGTRLLALLVFVAVVTTASARLAVMSIDLGGEYMKIAIVKPGVPMEVALNKESKRKTPTLVAFRDGERHFASQAQNTAIKFPQKAFGYLMQIIGRQYDDPQVELYRKRFPYYSMVKDEDRGTVLFKTDDGTLYSSEELLAMILEKGKEYAQDFAEQEIKDAVITVPAFYNQAERRAVITAANLVGINVLQLMSDNAAVALNYGVFRRKNFNSTMQYLMFYDMGSTSTTATIVGYNVVKTKEGTRMESNPQLTIKGIGFDRTLGGLEFTLRLRAHLAKAFNDQKKTNRKVQEDNRAMAKLFKEAERVKMVLSANNDHTAQVEGLIDEKDFRTHVTRAELEELTKDLFERVTKPIEEALKVSEITLPEISEIILMGGGTRLPKVQDILMKYLGRTELGKSINTDEAAALGAVYQAAYLGKGFKVKKFGVREGNIYPINVEFERQKSDEDNSGKSKMVKRTLFGRMNPYPQRKVMTFNKHMSDFSFNVMYSNLDFLTEDDRKSFGSPLISTYKLLGVADALAKNKDQAEPKGIKAHFMMDGSGILSLDRVESVFEKNGTADSAGKSAWSKIGSAIGGLFGGGGADEENKVEDSQEMPPEGGATSSNTQDDDSDGASAKTDDDSAAAKDDKTPEEDGVGGDESSTDKEIPAKDDIPEADTAGEGDGQEEDGEEKSGEEEKKEEKKDEKEEEKTEKDEKTVDGDKKDDEKKESGDKDKKMDDQSEKVEASDKKEEEKDQAPKVVNIKEVIQTEAEIHDVKDMSAERFKEAKKRLSVLRKADLEKVELEKAKNELESFIFDIQDKLTHGPYEKCSTEEQREELFAKFSEASDWLYEQPDDTKKSEFDTKLKGLKDMTKDLKKRVYELEERPKAVDALKSVLNQTSVFLETVKNLTSADDEDAIFTKVELDTMEKLINDTVKWRDETVAEQKKLKPSDNPVLLVEDVGQKIAALDREMRYLINKAKNFKPKSKPKEEKKKKEENTTASDKDTTTTTETPEQEDIPPPNQEEGEDTPDVEDTPEQETEKTSADYAESDQKDDQKTGDTESHTEL